MPSRKLLGPTYLHLIVCTLELEALIELGSHAPGSSWKAGFITRGSTGRYSRIRSGLAKSYDVTESSCRSGKGARAAVEALDPHMPPIIHIC